MEQDSNLSTSLGVANLSIVTQHFPLTKISKFAGLDGEYYFPSTYDFFAPLISKDKLELALFSGSNHTNGVTVSVGGAVQATAFDSIAVEAGTTPKIGKQIKIRQPRLASQQFVDEHTPLYDAYIQRTDTLARYPINYYGPRNAMLIPLANKDKQYRVPPLLPFAGASWHANTPPALLPQLEAIGIQTYDLDSLANIISAQTNTQLKPIRVIDTRTMCEVLNIDSPMDDPGAIHGMLTVMFGAFADNIADFIYYDISSDTPHIIANPNILQLQVQDIIDTYTYLAMVTSVDDLLFAVYNYPRYGGVHTFYRNQANGQRVDTNMVLSKPDYDFLDHLLVFNRGRTPRTFHQLELANCLNIIRAIAKNMASYVHGVNPVYAIEPQMYPDINLDLFITRLTNANYGPNAKIDYIPFELVKFYGGLARQYQNMKTFFILEDYEGDTTRLQPTRLVDNNGVIRNVALLPQQDGSKNTTLAVRSTFLAQGNAVYRSPRGEVFQVNFLVDRCCSFIPTAFNSDKQSMLMAYGLQWDSIGHSFLMVGNHNMVNTSDDSSAYNPLD